MAEQQQGHQPAEAPPLLRILTPGATTEEIAAIVAVFAALGQGAAGSETPTAPPAAWNAPARLVRHTHRHGPDGWRRSALPH